MNIAVLCAEADNIELRKYLDMFNIKCDTDNEISIFETSEDFLKDIESGCAYNLVFIDLETDISLQSATYIRKAKYKFIVQSLRCVNRRLFGYIPHRSKSGIYSSSAEFFS